MFCSGFIPDRHCSSPFPQVSFAKLTELINKYAPNALMVPATVEGLKNLQPLSEYAFIDDD